LDGKQIDNSGRLKGDVVIANADKIDITGGKVIADSAIVIKGKEINLESTTTNNKDGTNSIDKRATIKLTGKNNNGIIYIDGEDKLNSKAAKISNTSQGGNTTISGGEIELGTVTTSHNETFGEATDKNHRIVKTTEEIGTNINTAGNINVIAHSGRLNGTAVNINSKDGTALLYGKNGIAINEGRQTIKLDEAYQSKSKNLLSKKTNNYQIQRDDNLAINSNITGNKVIIQSQKDIDLTGTNAVSDNGTVIYSENGDVKINAAKNYYNREEERKVKKSGILGTGGIGFTIGKQKNKTENDNAALIHSGSMIGSINGDTNIYAGKDYIQTGSTVSSINGETIISGSKVDIKAAQNRNEDKYKQTFKQTGLTVSLSSPITDLAQKTAQSAQKIGKSKNDRINAMAMANAGYGVYSMIAKDNETGVSVIDNAKTAVNQLADGNLKNAAQSAGVKVSISYGQQQSKNQSNTQSTTAQESQVLGEKVHITARDSNINIIGSDVSGRLQTDLTAKNNVNIQSFKQTHTNLSNNKSSGFNAGVAVKVGNSMAVGFNASANYGKGKANGDSTTHRNSHVGSTTGKTNITAGETLNIKGGQVQGKGVGISAKDLNIESLHDTAIYHSKQQNLSGSVTIGAGANGTIGYNQSKINSDYASINEQSGIFAGDDGYQIHIKNHTDLTGGLITSTANAEQNGKNSFATGTLTFADLANKAEYSGNGFGIGVSGTIAGTPNNNLINVANKYSLSSDGIGYGHDSQSQQSVSKSGINTANIVITDKNKQQQITGKTAEETIKAVKTNIT
ncbi:MAG: hemagglutinin repeat-containing protein, partial [Neisseriaceae bacterium]|nr:hemagglutinin repeat-containing protein [Neisseriaceae bacterium]